jgi:hypothetical protein
MACTWKAFSLSHVSTEHEVVSEQEALLPWLALTPQLWGWWSWTEMTFWLGASGSRL